MRKWLQRKLRFWLQLLVRRLAPLILAEVEQERRTREGRRMRDLLAYLQSCGPNVAVAGELTITDPASVALGIGVSIGDGGRFDTAGGLTIGDGTQIGRAALIETVDRSGRGAIAAVAKPVMIGRNVWIGDRVCILPGVHVGDGARVSSGTVVSSNVAAGSGGIAARTVATEPGSVGHADDPAAHIFFVVSTGRCGSLTISQVLSQHPDVVCLHEPRPQLIRLATELAHREISRVQARCELEAIYCVSSVFAADRVCGESDQKYANLIPFLADLIPNSRFIWLIRDGRDVVASTSALLWFSSGGRTGNPVSPDLTERWIYYWLNGARCGAFSPEEWNGLSPFERNCWYWSYVNSEIEQHLKALPPSRWCSVTLEEFGQKTDDVFRFLGVAPKPVTVRQYNKSDRDAKRWNAWSATERARFEQRCGAGMDRWYPEWRACDGAWRLIGTKRGGAHEAVRG